MNINKTSKIFVWANRWPCWSFHLDPYTLFHLWLHKWISADEPFSGDVPVGRYLLGLCLNGCHFNYIFKHKLICKLLNSNCVFRCSKWRHISSSPFFSSALLSVRMLLTFNSAITEFYGPWAVTFQLMTLEVMLAGEKIAEICDTSHQVMMLSPTLNYVLRCSTFNMEYGIAHDRYI